MASRTRLPLAAVMVGTSSILIARAAAATVNWPDLQWDPETNPSCVTWSTPQPDQTCEEFIKYFTMTPAEFHGYNPNIGLDCSGWIGQQSYCIADEARDAQFWTTVTDPYWTSMRPTSTSATATITSTYTTDGTPVPSPLVWRPLSCYHTGLDPFGPGQVLEKQLIKGDKTLTTQKCLARCWDAMPSKKLTLAGLRNGDECWCGPVPVESYHTTGDYNGCNITCPGDPKQTQCGGKEHMALWEAVILYGKGPYGVVPTGSASVTASGGGQQSTASSSGGAGQSGGSRSNGPAWAVLLSGCAGAVLRLLA